MNNETDLPDNATTSPDITSFNATDLAASLTANDIVASLAWYRDVMGFTVEREFEHEGQLRAVSLKAGSVRILLTQDNGAKGMNRPKGEGFSLQLTTDQNIDELANRIRENGGTLESEPTDVMGARGFRLLDPNGFRLVISSPRHR